MPAFATHPLKTGDKLTVSVRDSSEVADVKKAIGVFGKRLQVAVFLAMREKGAPESLGGTSAETFSTITSKAGFSAAVLKYWGKECDDVKTVTGLDAPLIAAALAGKSITVTNTTSGKSAAVPIKGGSAAQTHFLKTVYKSGLTPTLTNAVNSKGGAQLPFIKKDGDAAALIGSVAKKFSFSNLSAEFKAAAKESRVPDVLAIVKYVSSVISGKNKGAIPTGGSGFAFSESAFNEKVKLLKLTKADLLESLGGVPYPVNMMLQIKNLYVPNSAMGIKYKTYTDAQKEMAKTIFNASKGGDTAMDTALAKWISEKGLRSELTKKLMNMLESYSQTHPNTKPLYTIVGRLISLGAKTSISVKKMEDKSSTIHTSSLKILNRMVGMALPDQLTSALSTKGANLLTGVAHDVLVHYTGVLGALRAHKVASKKKASSSSRVSAYTADDVVKAAKFIHGPGHLTMTFSYPAPVKFAKMIAKRGKGKEYSKRMVEKAASLLPANNDLRKEMEAINSEISKALKEKKAAVAKLKSTRKKFPLPRGDDKKRKDTYAEFNKHVADKGSIPNYDLTSQQISNITTLWTAEQMLHKEAILSSRPSDKLKDYVGSQSLYEVHRLFRNGPRCRVGFSNDVSEGAVSIDMQLCRILERYSLYHGYAKVAKYMSKNSLPGKSLADVLNTLGRAAEKVGGADAHALVKNGSLGDVAPWQRMWSDKKKPLNKKNELRTMVADDYAAMHNGKFLHPLHKRCGIQNSYRRLITSMIPKGLKLSQGGKLVMAGIIEWVLSSLLRRAQLFKNSLAVSVLKSREAESEKKKKTMAMPAQMGYDTLSGREKYSSGPHILPKDIGAAMFFPSPHFQLINLFEQTHTSFHQGRALLPTYLPADVMDKLTPAGVKGGKVPLKKTSKKLKAQMTAVKKDLKEKQAKSEKKLVLDTRRLFKGTYDYSDASSSDSMESDSE